MVLPFAVVGGCFSLLFTLHSVLSIPSKTLACSQKLIGSLSQFPSSL